MAPQRQRGQGVAPRAARDRTKARPEASDRVAFVETINGCAVMRASEATEPVRIGSAEVSGAYVVEVGMFPPGQAGPPLHLHPHTDELFYIADGDATFQLGDSELELSAGALVIVPSGAAHTVWNSGDRPVRGLIVISPGNVEHEFIPVEPG
jgi:mannose-6-phosphate isomerase-like protein (cupin superfamily)